MLALLQKSDECCYKEVNDEDGGVQGGDISRINDEFSVI